MPSELSKRLLQAQSGWDAELQNLRACVKQLETDRDSKSARDRQQSWSKRGLEFDTDNEDQLLAAISSKLEAIDGVREDIGSLRSEMQLLHDGQDTAVGHFRTHCELTRKTGLELVHSHLDVHR